ncbi:MAG: hypothetical protein ABI193_09885 [Minicystis sp.]
MTRPIIRGGAWNNFDASWAPGCADLQLDLSVLWSEVDQFERSGDASDAAPAPEE